MNLFLFIFLTTSAHAASLKLACDATLAATGYRWWRGIELLASSATPTAVVDLPVGMNSVVTVTAINAAGESPRSEALVIYVNPEPRLTIQFSTDLTAWSDLPFPEARFYRIKKEWP